ncbi:Tyrosine-protein kinase ephrin type A-B receptor-like [Babesia duncani]|uniref:Tyrosine-protein kinase ephrin type A-B receptor-like n=1 Tax=Babesia duncani TaxID=323732 RepID=A0AAD9PNN2_9APIC|nr:Tyrosine-protein kinase ephrin type A-B receptor-like [Babesia duncani]
MMPIVVLRAVWLCIYILCIAKHSFSTSKVVEPPSASEIDSLSNEINKDVIEKANFDEEIVLKKRVSAYQSSLATSLLDEECKTKYSPYSICRCSQQGYTCGCHSLSKVTLDIIAKECPLNGQVVNCLGGAYTTEPEKYARKYLSLINRGNGRFVRPDVIKRPSSKKTEGYNFDKNIPSVIVNQYKNERVRGSTKPVSDILESIKTNPFGTLYSTLYYSNSDFAPSKWPELLPKEWNPEKDPKKKVSVYLDTFEQRKEINDQNIKTAEACLQWNILNKRHGIAIDSKYKCYDWYTKRCKSEITTEPCVELVPRIFYRNINEEFFLDIEYFTLSRTFSIQIIKGDVICNKKNGEIATSYSVYTPDLATLIPSEIIVNDRRVFKFGPFKPIKESGVYTICGCFSDQGKTNEPSICNELENFDRNIGKVIFSAKDPATEETVINGKITVSNSNSTAILIPSHLINGDCSSLFDLYSYDWKNGSIENLPGLRKHMIIQETTSQNKNTVFDQTMPGIYKVCFIDRDTLAVSSSRKNYLVEGFIDNARAILYNSNGGLKSHSLIFESYGFKNRKVEFVAMLMSPSNCTSLIVGLWSGGVEPYPDIYSKNGSKRWITTNFQYKWVNKPDRQQYRICVKFEDDDLALWPIGIATFNGYWDYAKLYENLPLIKYSRPDDIYNFNMKPFSNFDVSWLKKAPNISKGNLMSTGGIDEVAKIHVDRLIEIPCSKILHFQCFSSIDMVTLWMSSSNDQVLYPLGHIQIESPLALRMLTTSSGMYWYVLMKTTNLILKYNVTIFKSAYTPDDVVAVNNELLKPTGIEILQNGETIRILVTDIMNNCVYMFDKDLIQLKQICDKSGGIVLQNLGRLSCDAHTANPNIFHCFATMPLLNSILWIKVDIGNDDIHVLGTYKSGSVVDDLDPELGSPSSLVAFHYNTGDTSNLMVAFTRENGENGAILYADEVNKRLIFQSIIHKMPGYGRVMSINLAFADPNVTTLFLLREDSSHGNIKKYVNTEEIVDMLETTNGAKWYLTWATLNSLVEIPDISYDLLDWMVIQDEYVIENSLHHDYQRFPLQLRYSIEAVDSLLDDYIRDTFSMNPITGDLTISITSVKAFQIDFNIVVRLFGAEKKIPLSVKITCLDGEYFDGNNCRPCPIATYNSIAMIKNDHQYWSMCKRCDQNESTFATQSTTADSCVCIAGYALKKTTKPGEARCQPCPAGTYKTAMGMDNCVGECYKNSYTTVVGSSTDAGRLCKCLPGFYWGGHGKNTMDCLPCEKGYFCEGGYRSKATKCPLNTTTNTAMATSVDQCTCIAGYEPANPKLIETSGTPEHAFKLLLTEKYNIMGNNSLVCVPCAYNKYKDTNSSSQCLSCPKHSYSLHNANTKKSDCDKCLPGYYETNNKNDPCAPCLPNHYCVGSVPLDQNFFAHAGKAMPCPEMSATFPPYEKNTHMIHCMCDKGYKSVDDSVYRKCVPVTKGYFKDTIGNGPGIKCPYGSTTEAPGATSHDECACDPGRFFDSETKYCRSCPLGKYCPGGRDSNLQHLQPLTCPDLNEATNKKGASSIADCYCKAGYFKSITGQDGCVPCPENHYKDSTSPDKCSPCDDNSSTNGMQGATSKEQCVCEPGYYFDKSCVPCSHTNMYCPGGTLKDNTLRALYTTHPPVSCPANTEIPPGMDAASSYDDCKCAKGYGFILKDPNTKTKICEPCPPGTYKSSVMDSSCNGLCTQNATSVPGAKSPAQCFCQVGYFYLAGGICTSCLEGAECKGGLVSDAGKGLHQDLQDHVKPVAISGYYLDKIQTELKKTDDWKFIKCPIPGACLGKDKCSQSMTGYLCSECKKGYTNNFVKGAICRPCPKTMVNVSLNILWYLGLLLVNIVMACLNVSAGFNRRSVHSVVIKIALNYGICMSVLNAINFSELSLPSNIKSMTMSWAKVLYHDNKIHYTSIDCLLQRWFNMKHADSFFYTMLFIACLPAILLVVVTLLMWIILELFKIKRYKTTRSKLILLQQSQAQGMQYLSERLYDEYSNERLFLIFRYIPLPGETSWVRFKHFMEDMIPIYVTVLFSLHDNTTSQMLSLLDCTCINLGRSLPSKYILRPAMSIKCSLDPKMGYIPYLILGLSGLIIWGFGIPFFSFFVLLINRKNLYAPDIRMKYGFLHNGYQQHYWFWETIVFIRKCLVLVIGSIVIVPSQNGSGSRIWMALVVAVIFLIAQLIYKPFDERDYFVLGRLESHSMIAWTLSLLIVAFIFHIKLSPWGNALLLMLLILNVLLFLFSVIKNLLRSLVDALRFKRNNKILRRIGWLLELIFYFDTKKRSREPRISYNQSLSQVEVKHSRKRKSWLYSSYSSLNTHERYYFVCVITELYRMAFSRLKLDVVPKLFMEFLIRLSLTFTKFEEKISNRQIFKDLADGYLSQLVVLAAEQETRKLNKIVNLNDISMSNHPVNNEVLSAKIGLKQEELQSIIDCLFDDEMLLGNTSLSELYLSITRIWIMDTVMLTVLFSVFKNAKAQFDKQKVEKLKGENAKLIKLSKSLQEVLEHGVNKALKQQLPIEEMQANLDQTLVKKRQLQDQLKELQKNPDLYMTQANDVILPEIQSGTINVGKDKAMDALLSDFGFNKMGQSDSESSSDYTSSSSYEESEYESDSS